MAATLICKRDDVTWNMEKLVAELKRMLAQQTLHVDLKAFLCLLKRHIPARFGKRPCNHWIGHDAYETYVLYNEYTYVSNDFVHAVVDLQRIQRDFQDYNDDVNFMYRQVELLIDTVLDKTYYWEEK
jgi:hypothetical protein